MKNGRFARYGLLSVVLALALSACTPATITAFFAPCPEPTEEEWAAYQEEWLRSGGIEAPVAEDPGAIR